MPEIPDLSDPRYLDEVGWFLYHEKYRRDRFGGSYDAERLANSRLLRDEVAKYMDRDVRWFEDRTVVTIGCGCTGDLCAFPAGVKVAIDPLLYTYQHLGMLVPDEADRRIVHEVIYEELCRGVIDDGSREQYRRIMRALAARGAQGILLGCTEIELLVGPEDAEVPLFDTTRLHAVRAVELALG